MVAIASPFFTNSPTVLMLNLSSLPEKWTTCTNALSSFIFTFP